MFKTFYTKVASIRQHYKKRSETVPNTLPNQFRKSVNTGLKKVFSGRFTLKVNGLKYDSSQSEGDYFHSYFILSNRNFSVGTGDLLSNLKSYRFELYFDFNSKFAASKFRPGKFNSPLVLRVSTTPFSFMNFKEIKYETILESDLERSWEK